MATLELLDARPGEAHGGDVFCCTYTPDGAFVLSGGWDGCLRLWDASSGAVVTGFRTGPKPLSACAVTPEAARWVSGSMEGTLGLWDAVTHQPRLSLMAHTRPISAVCYAPDGQHLATASWDRQVMVRAVGKEGEGRSLAGHLDIVAGCRYAHDGKHLLSWSHDGTVRLWDAEAAREVACLKGHDDRVSSVCQSPDGRWLVSGGRDGLVRLWDLPNRAKAGRVRQPGEVRACFFVFDATLVVTADAAGRITLLSAPGFEVGAELDTGVKVQCADLAPSGRQLALGGEDGRVHFVTLSGVEPTALMVTPTPATRRKASMIDRLFGKTRETSTYEYTCPSCRRLAESPSLPKQPFPCPHCRRDLRVETREPLLQRP